eukprot:COSAG06_NODE_468_length_15337_cov_84.949075_10_plen_326_part_00
MRARSTCAVHEAQYCSTAELAPRRGHPPPAEVHAPPFVSHAEAPMPDWTTVSHPPARTSPWATLSVAHAAGTVNDSGKVLEGFSGHGLAALEATLDSIGAARYVSLGELAIGAWSSAEPLPFAQRREGEQRALRVGDKWGGLFDCAWMRFTGTVPPAAAGRPVSLLLDVNGEMCVVDAHGVPQRGLTSLTSEFDLSLGKPGKRAFPLAAAATPGPVEVWADCGCNDLFGSLQENGVVRQAELVAEHPEVEALYYDFDVLLDFLKVLPEASARWRQVLQVLTAAARAVQPDVRAGVAAARAQLAPQLAKRGGDADLRISAIGHAHM